MQTKEYSLEVGGQKITAVFSDLAEQAHGSVMLRSGDTIVLATAVMGPEPAASLGYFNLTVDYVEKFYASGEILGSRFIRREGRPSDEAILGSRVIDRTIRPLFNQAIKNPVQVIVTVLSMDEENDPITLAVNAASLALSVSNIPWNGPVGCVRIGKKNGGNFMINPPKCKRKKHATFSDGQLKELEEEIVYDFELLACGKDGNVNMIEAATLEVPESEITNGLERAVKEISLLEDFQKKIIAEKNPVKKNFTAEELPAEAIELFTREILPALPKTVFADIPGKENIETLKEHWKKILKETFPDVSKTLADDYFEHAVDETVHQGALKENKRADGRDFQTVRPLYAQAGGVSPILHGSGIFYRGGTHVFSALTLGGPEDAHLIEGMEVKEEKRFMHHYNFPPFSAGEVGRATFTGRREIGHGALAEKALVAVIPPKEIFPYTIRLVSEAFASNGSTSMASVCASTLSLMDGGVPILAPVAGIAMGLMSEFNSKGQMTNYKILTDIQGPEDHHGDMDFKVAGTEKGVTAIQMDVKVLGVPMKVLTEALAGERAARLHILETIKQTISAPRPDISPNAPRVLITKIKKDQIGLVIGSGGKTINGIRDETGAEITIEEDGTVYVTGPAEGAKKALEIVQEMTHEWKVGEVAEGEVVKITDFGAFVAIGRGGHTEGLVHISEIAPFRVGQVSDILKEGDKVPVQIKEVDETGRIKLSIKNADPNYARIKAGVDYVPTEAPAGNFRPPRRSTFGGGRGGKGGRR